MAAPFPYATTSELEAFVQDAYELPADPSRMLNRAGELIRHVIGGSDVAAMIVETHHLDALRDAVCAQVEFWLEVGEEHDVAAVTGDAPISVAGISLSRLPARLAPRARRFLGENGLASGLIGVAG